MSTNDIFEQLSFFEKSKDKFVKSIYSGEIFRLVDEQERHFLIEGKKYKIPIRVLKDGFERVENANI